MKLRKYEGVSVIRLGRAPTPDDYGKIPTFWIDETNKNAYILVSVDNNNGRSYWIEVAATASGTTTASGGYSGQAELSVGGISDGQVFVNADMQSMWDALLKQEKYPTLTSPSSSFTSSITGFREVGEVVTIVFDSMFDRGSISPQYTSASSYRSGLPNEYQYIGSGLSNQSKTDLTDSQTVSNHTVVINGQSWQGRVSYDAGVQPKSSYDNDYDSPLPAGSTSYITRTITGVYPYFATTVNISTMTKQSLAAHGSTITVDMATEGGGDKQSLEVPDEWGSVSTIYQWNTLTSQWDAIALGSFTLTSLTKAIQGNTVDYNKYTHNGSLLGARQLRFVF